MIEIVVRQMNCLPQHAGSCAPNVKKRRAGERIAHLPQSRDSDPLRPTKGVAPRLRREVSMLECSPPINFADLAAAIRMSLYECGEEEAQRFKWIESEKAGRDLGEAAIRTWVRSHWNGFLRQRWLEHLQGKTYWI